MKNKLRLLVVVVLAAGCSTAKETRVQEKFADRPAAYRDGYVVGCSSGTAEAAHRDGKASRDENRMLSDSIYANGWYDGFESCRDSYRPSPNDARHDPTKPVRSDGHGW